MSDETQGGGNPVAEAVKQSANRTKYTFKVPEASRTWASDPSTITMVELTLNEEQQASKSARVKEDSVAYALAVRSLVGFDGKTLTWEGNEKERAVERCSPKVRALILQAFQKLHVPADKGEVDAFLDSMSAQA